MTNALIHTGSDGQIEIQRQGTGVRVTIVDSSPVMPAQRRHSTTATTGRGCQLLQRLSHEWGAERQLLAPEQAPVMGEFARWYLNAFVSQLAGGPAARWDGPRHP